MAPGHVYVYAICSFYQRNLAKQGEETVSTSCLEIKFAFVYVFVMYVCMYILTGMLYTRVRNVSYY